MCGPIDFVLKGVPLYFSLVLMGKVPYEKYKFFEHVERKYVPWNFTCNKDSCHTESVLRKTQNSIADCTWDTETICLCD